MIINRHTKIDCFLLKSSPLVRARGRIALSDGRPNTLHQPNLIPSVCPSCGNHYNASAGTAGQSFSIDNAGYIVDNAGHIVDNAGHIVDNAGHIVDNAGYIVDNARRIVDNAGRIVDNAGYGAKALASKSKTLAFKSKATAFKSFTQTTITMMYLRGRREPGFRVIFVSGDPRDRANGGFRVWYSVGAG
jgi:hypothetical protein